MLSDPLSHGLWERTAPKPPLTLSLKGSLRADVVVCGAGYTGLSAALHLAERGVSVIVLEAAEVGFGGSGRNVGLVNAGMWVMPDLIADVLGTEYGERLIALLGNAPSFVFDLIERKRIRCEATRAGTLHCADSQAGLRELEQRTEQWSKRGAPVRLLSASQTQKKIGTQAYRGALLDARAGTVQPLAYVRGLAEAAIQAGVRVFTRSPLQGMERSGSAWNVLAPSGSVSCDWLVVATDAYTTGPWSAIRREQTLLPYFNVATEPLPLYLTQDILPDRQGVWDTNKVLTSFRFDQQNRLVFGSVGALRGTGRAVHRGWASRAIRKLFPQLDGVQFESEWYGQIGMTSDNLPRYHCLATNVISFSGFNGRGIAPGTVFGKVLAERILGVIGDRDLPIAPTETNDARFRLVRQAVYEIGSQAVHFSAARI
jgi:glycine/D-amino acid oxidase-like deaminating enzyme